MNNISLFLYFADVLQNLSIFLGVFLFLGGIAFLAVTAFMGVTNSDWRDSRREKDSKPPFRMYLFILLWGFYLLLALAAVAIPSKDTMYLMAGSEIAEVVAKTPEAREILDETRKAVLDQIKSLQRGSDGKKDED